MLCQGRVAPQGSPLPSLVLALRIGIAWGTLAEAGRVTCSATAAAAAAAAAATAAGEDLKGLLALNSRHLAPRMVIILDMGILGFFLAIRGLKVHSDKEPWVYPFHYRATQCRGREADHIQSDRKTEVQAPAARQHRQKQNIRLSLPVQHNKVTNRMEAPPTEG